MRKVLSFVLVLSLVLGSFSMAFAATPAPAGLSDIADSANADAIQVAYDLGIVTGNPDGTFLPEKSVTRAEFAAMITRALAVPETALAGYTATTFKDTVGYGWAVPYLAFAQSKGIMLGDGNGNVMPGRTINVNEAMTMVLRAVGYTSNSAELVGAWPANYVTLAQNVSLYDDVANVVNVDKANAAQIIYNALTVQKVAVNADGETKYLEKSEDVEANLLNTGLGCDTDSDKTITGADYENASINITKYMGAFGTAYTKDGDIVAFTLDSTALTGSISDGKFKVGDVKYSFGDEISTGASVILNTDAIIEADAIDAAHVDAFAANSDTDVTLYVDLSGKTIKDVYSMVGWEVTDAKVLATADVDDLEDNELLTKDFATNDDEAIDANSFKLVGAESIDKLAKDNVVYVYANDLDVIRMVAVGTEVVTGNVTEFAADDYVVVNDKQYEAAAFVGAVTDVELPALDSDVTMSLDAYGKIFDVDETTATTAKFAVVKYYDHNDGQIDNSRIKLYTSDDATKTFTFADENAEIDWLTDASIDVTSETAMNAALDADTLVGYDLDADGYVDTLNLKATTATVTIQSNKVLVNGTEYISIASDVVVFVNDNGTYSIETIANVDKGVEIAGASYILNDDDKVGAILLPDTTAVTVDDSDVYGVINAATLVKDGDDTVQKLAGFIDSAAFSKLGDANDVVASAPVLDLYKITVDANGVITNAVTMGAVEVASASGVIIDNATVTAVNADRTVLTVTDGAVSGKFTVDDQAVVYKAVMKADGVTLDKFEVAKLSDIKVDYKVYLYDTKGEDANGIANVVIYIAD